jgi:hypothetical protein
MMASAGPVTRDEAVGVPQVKAWLALMRRPLPHGPVLNLHDAAASTFRPFPSRIDRTPAASGIEAASAKTLESGFDRSMSIPKGGVRGPALCILNRQVEYQHLRALAFLQLQAAGPGQF